jgi:hypothetical protein
MDGMTVGAGTPVKVAGFLQKETARFVHLIETAGIKGAP